MVTDLLLGDAFWSEEVGQWGAIRKGLSPPLHSLLRGHRDVSTFPLRILPLPFRLGVV